MRPVLRWLAALGKLADRAIANRGSIYSGPEKKAQVGWTTAP